MNSNVMVNHLRRTLRHALERVLNGFGVDSLAENCPTE